MSWLWESDWVVVVIFGAPVVWVIVDHFFDIRRRK